MEPGPNSQIFFRDLAGTQTGHRQVVRPRSYLYSWLLAPPLRRSVPAVSAHHVLDAATASQHGSNRCWHFWRGGWRPTRAREARVCPVAKRHKAKPSLQVTAPEVAAAGALRRAPITGLRHQPHQELLAKPPSRKCQHGSNRCWHFRDGPCWPPVWLGPFDDDNDSFFVLVNDEERHSLWPTFADVPTGWRVVYTEADRVACLHNI
jgi:uncharacterized protein YbdZ (MbtH family)